jgi:LysM domain-containing protein
MSVLVDGDPAAGHVTEGRVRASMPLRARRLGGEPRRPPTRTRVVAGRRRVPLPDCAPRPVAWHWRLLAGLALAAGLVVGGLGLFAGRMSDTVPERTAIVTVSSGETLWEVARQYAPDADTAAVVARIRQINRLGDGTVVPGLPLTVPVEADFVVSPH